MTQLIPNSERDALGIDTLSRTIIYAVHILEYVTKDNIDLAENVGFVTTSQASDDTVKTAFTAQVDLTYNEANALTSGFKLWGNINNLTAVASPTYLASLPTSPTPTNSLPTEPTEVNTVEKYFYWACQILSASTSPNTEYISYNFEKDANTVSVVVSLPLNYQKTLLGANTLEASINFINTYITDINQAQSDWVIPPSAQYWGEPIDDIAALKSLIKNLSTTLWVTSQAALYTLISALPDGESADDDLYIVPDDRIDSEVARFGKKGVRVRVPIQPRH